ncbi:MAG: glycerophosphodiester phosphodiesterase [Alkalispirochaeta sp.]
MWNTRQKKPGVTRHAHYVSILAHRGGSDGRFPENSIAAFAEGLRCGADVLELDVRLCRDGHVVVIHDPVVTIDGTGERGVDTMGHREMENGTRRGDAGIPTLPEVLARFPGNRFNIDLKVDTPALAVRVAEHLRSSGATHRSVVASFLPRALDYFRRVAPEVATSTHPGEVRSFLLRHLIGVRPSSPAYALQIPLRHRSIPLVTRRFVSYAHRHGYAVHVWTINDPTEAVRLAEMGVDGIVTDRVGVIHDALSERGFRRGAGQQDTKESR